MASLEGWSDIMYAASDATGKHMQPERDANRYIALLFIIAQLIAAFFMLNLVIGVTISKVRGGAVLGVFCAADGAAVW